MFLKYNHKYCLCSKIIINKLCPIKFKIAIIAKKIGKMLNCKEPKIVSGPSLLNKYVGESEKNVRDLFQEAMDDTKGEDLHLIICDEFDALCKSRGSSRSDAGVGDNVVNQFLSMIDGPEELNNVLLICMTNRKDMIDSAILRSGRIEVHIEIDLPTLEGRKEILAIHTKQLFDNHYIDADVNIDHLAFLTKNYTGAELSGLVRNASSYAISREVAIKDGKVSDPKSKAVPHVTMGDFMRALDEIVPQFGKASDEIHTITSTPFIFWNEILESIHSETLSKIKTLRAGNISTVLMTGEQYVGKTKLISHIAKDSDVSCIRMITPEKLLKSMDKSLYILNIFEQCKKAESSILILDGFERLIEWTSLGARFNNTVLQTFVSLITAYIDPTKKMTIMCTANSDTVLKDLDFYELFDTHYEYPTDISLEAISKFFPKVYESFNTEDSVYKKEFYNISQVLKYSKYV